MTAAEVEALAKSIRDTPIEHVGTVAQLTRLVQALDAIAATLQEYEQIHVEPWKKLDICPDK
jgi:hypothetical protein